MTLYKLLHQMYIIWINNTIKQKVTMMSVITSHRTLSPRLCSDTVWVCVWVRNCTTHYTLLLLLLLWLEITTIKDHNSLEVGFFQEWDCWGTAPAESFQLSLCRKSKFRIISFRTGRALWSHSKEETCTKALLVPISFASQYFIYKAILPATFCQNKDV